MPFAESMPFGDYEPLTGVCVKCRTIKWSQQMMVIWGILALWSQPRKNDHKISIKQTKISVTVCTLNINLPIDEIS